MVQSMLNFNVVHCIIEMKHQKPLKTLSEIVKISNNHVEAPKYNGFLDHTESREPHLVTSASFFMGSILDVTRTTFTKANVRLVSLKLLISYLDN